MTNACRASSAHTAQRLSLLLTELARRDATSMLRNEDNDDFAPTKEWRKRRAAVWPDDPYQQQLFALHLFQDDIIVIVIGNNNAQKLDEFIKRKFQELEVTLSTKPDASQLFAGTFDALGVTFDVTNPKSPSCRPAYKSIKACTQAQQEMKESAGKPLYRTQAEV